MNALVKKSLFNFQSIAFKSTLKPLVAQVTVEYLKPKLNFEFTQKLKRKAPASGAYVAEKFAEIQKTTTVKGTNLKTCDLFAKFQKEFKELTEEQQQKYKDKVQLNSEKAVEEFNQIKSKQTVKDVAAFKLYCAACKDLKKKVPEFRNYIAPRVLPFRLFANKEISSGKSITLSEIVDLFDNIDPAELSKLEAKYAPLRKQQEIKVAEYQANLKREIQELKTKINAIYKEEMKEYKALKKESELKKKSKSRQTLKKLTSKK